MKQQRFSERLADSLGSPFRGIQQQRVLACLVARGRVRLRLRHHLQASGGDICWMICRRVFAATSPDLQQTIGSGPLRMTFRSLSGGPHHHSLLHGRYSHIHIHNPKDKTRHDRPRLHPKNQKPSAYAPKS